MFLMNCLPCSRSSFRVGRAGLHVRIGFDLCGWHTLGKGYEKGATFSRDAAALHPDKALHGFDQLTTEIQAQTGSTLCAIDSSVQAHKFREEARLISW